MKTVKILENELSLQRPAWTQRNLQAYKDRHFTTPEGRHIVSKNYFEKTNGLLEK